MLAGLIGKNIKAARKRKDMTLAELAERMDPPTSHQQISRLEAGDRSLKVEWVERIAKALGVDAMELVTGEAAQAPPKTVFTLDEQAASEAARTLALIARDGDPADDGTVQALALIMREIFVTFSEHPEAANDPKAVRAVVSLLARTHAHAKN